MAIIHHSLGLCWSAYLPCHVEVWVDRIQHSVIVEMQVLVQELVTAFHHEVGRALAQDDDMAQVSEEVFVIVQTRELG